MVTHATIVSGIGGTTIASEKVFRTKPDYILSYPDFASRDSHLLKYYDNEIDYRVVGQDNLDDLHEVDVFSTTCPCAGLSSLTGHSHAESLHNDWMINSADFAMGRFRPKVFWGENAPRLTADFGKPVLDRMREIADKHGYSLTIYETFALNHNVPQVRKRAFYFFWRDGKVPVFPFTDDDHRNYKSVEQTIFDAASDDSDPMWTYTRRKGKPSEDLYYRYILDVIEGGVSHKDFSQGIDHTCNVFKYIEAKGHSYYDVGDWATANGYTERQREIAHSKQVKLDRGNNITRKGVIIPKNYTAAFVGPLTWNMTHPIEDRYIRMREALAIMGFDRKMEIIKPNVNFKDLTKSVPIGMAVDMVKYIDMHLNGKLPIREDVNFLIQDNRNKKFKDTETFSLEDFLI